MIAGVSVIICTYNGALLLPETLLHLALQQVRSDVPWEVIVVNNASSDSTTQVIETEWQKYAVSVPFTLLHQPKPGLTFAREMALKNARFEFVLFCDDDNWLNPNYINLAYDIMLGHPETAVLGGHGNLVFEHKPSAWVKSHRLFASGPQEEHSGKVKQKVVYGAGCIVRRSMLDNLFTAGFYSLLTDRQGNTLSAGGDYELCLALALAGYEIRYDSRLTFSHYIPAKRLTWQYHVKLIQEGAKSFEALVPYRARVNLGALSVLGFQVQALKILAGYLKKLTAAYLQKPDSQAGSDEEKARALAILSLKAKIRSFGNFPAMIRNFKKIRQFEQEQAELFLVKPLVPEPEREMHLGEKLTG